MIVKIAVICLGLSMGMLNPGIAQADTLTLKDGLSFISAEGYDLRIARAREAAAVRSRDRARSHLKPQVSAYTDHTWLQNKPEAVFGGGTSPLGDDSFLRYGITVRQLITDFGQTRSGIEAASAGARSQLEETGRTRNTAALDFIESYVLALQAEKNLTLADLEVQRFESHVRDAKALHDAGEVTLNDVLAAEVALADARLRRITALDERDLAISRLNYLMLRPLDSPVSVVAFPFQLDPLPSLEDSLVKSGIRRPELKALNEMINSKEAEIHFNETQGFPTLFVSGGYSYEENPYRLHEDNWSAMVGLTWELYTGGARTAEQKQKEDELTSLLIQREQLLEHIKLEVRNSYRLLNGALERILVTQKAVTQANESLRLQRSRYNEGEATAIEVTDAVTSLAHVENNYWSAVYGRLRSEAQLLYAAGDDLMAVYLTSSAITPDEPVNQVIGEQR